MEIQGNVIQILPLQEGVSKTGNPWSVQPFVIETPEQYPKKVHCELFGSDRIKNNPFAIDDNVKVSFDLESREFNGRWYTSVRAWKVEKEGQAAAGESAAPAAPLPTDAAPQEPQLPLDGGLPQEESTDLPF